MPINGLLVYCPKALSSSSTILPILSVLYFYAMTSAVGARKRSSSVTTEVRKGILKTNQPSSVSNHGNEQLYHHHKSQPQMSLDPTQHEVRPCCCCPQMNMMMMMHPQALDHYGANYVSHCHTENSRWRPNVAVLEPQLTTEASPKRTPIALKSRKNPTQGCKDSIDLFHIQKARAPPMRSSRTPPLKKKNETKGGTVAISEARTTSSSSKVVKLFLVHL